MASPIDRRFDFLYDDRPEKPRSSGRTMVIGDGPYNVAGENYIDDLLTASGAWIDEYKFVHGTLPFQPPELIQRKLELFDEHDVHAFTGGNFFESAIMQGSEEQFLDALEAVGCPGIEISTTVTDISLEKKIDLVERAASRGFEVHGEIGEKTSETGGEPATLDEIVNESHLLLDAGADVVVVEREELESGVDESGSREAVADAVTRIVDDVGLENLVFELPFTPTFLDVMETTAWYFDLLGTETNLGNVHPEHVLLIEEQRRGIGPHMQHS